MIYGFYMLSLKDYLIQPFIKFRHCLTKIPRSVSNESFRVFCLLKNFKIIILSPEYKIWCRWLGFKSQRGQKGRVGGIFVLRIGLEWKCLETYSTKNAGENFKFKRYLILEAFLNILLFYFLIRSSIMIWISQKLR